MKAIVAGLLVLAAAACAQDSVQVEREARIQERSARLAERKPPVIAADMPVDSEPIQILCTGLVRTTTGQPIANAAVEMQMNPYHPGVNSTKTWTATDSAGNYALQGIGHHGTARVRVAAEGFRADIRELGFIKRNREISFNFALAQARDRDLSAANAVQQ